MLRRSKKNLKLQTKIIILVCGVCILCLLVTNYFIQKNVEETIVGNIEEKARNMSRTAALSPVFTSGLSGEIPEDKIQQYAEELRKATNVAFIVVLDMKGIRKSHPMPEKIGQKYAGGDAGKVFEGEEHTSIAKGTLGMSLRYFTPVYNEDGEQIGAILVGFLLDGVQKKVNESHAVIIASMLVGMVVGLIGAILMAKKVKKILFGMEPDEIAKLLEQRSAILDYAREGVLAVDRSSRITLLNQEGSRLVRNIGIINPMEKKAEDILPQIPFMSVMKTGDKELDQEYSLNGLDVVANILPIYVNQEIVGAVATFRDKTEIRQMTEQLTGVKAYAEALRAQTHEFMNKLHVILGMVQLEFYDQIPDYVKGITDRFQSEVGYITSRIKDPVLAGFILGKVSFSREKGAKLTFSEDSYLPKSQNKAMVQDLVTILGNLIDNSLDAVQGSQEKRIELEIKHTEDGHLAIRISDTGNGIEQDCLEKVFVKGFSTKGENRGIGLHLVQNVIKKLGGRLSIHSDIDNGTEICMDIPYEIQGE